MQIVGNLRMMEKELVDCQPQYKLPLNDVLEPINQIEMNDLIGQTIRIEYEGYYNSIL